MTLKLSEMEDEAKDEIRWHPGGRIEDHELGFIELINWAKRARPWIQKSYSQQVKEREVIEDLYGAQEPYISGLADDIAELEQLLEEVEE